MFSVRVLLSIGLLMALADLQEHYMGMPGGGGKAAVQGSLN